MKDVVKELWSICPECTSDRYYQGSMVGRVCRICPICSTEWTVFDNGDMLHRTLNGVLIYTEYEPTNLPPEKGTT